MNHILVAATLIGVISDLAFTDGGKPNCVATVSMAAKADRIKRAARIRRSVS